MASAVDTVLPSPTTEHNVAYTDGSGKGGGGYGVVLITLATQYHVQGRLPSAAALAAVLRGDDLPSVSSSQGEFSAQLGELFAVYVALRLTWGGLIICSDSEYVVKTFTDYVFRWLARSWTKSTGPIAHLPLIQAIYALCQNRDIRWFHVPAHRGIILNELADQLASAGALGSDALLLRENGMVLRQR